MKISDVMSSRISWPQGQNFVLGLVLVLEDLSSTCPCTGLVKSFVMLVLVIFLSLQRFDRKLDESNDYVTKLTMLISAVYSLIVSSMYIYI